MDDSVWLLNLHSILLGAAAIGLIVFWVMMLLDVIKNKKLEDTTRLIWGIGLIILPPLALLYYFAGRSPKK